MRAFVEVLGPGVSDAGTSVSLFVDGARYLFCCGDGTQRVLTEASVKPNRLRGVYVPSLSAAHVGGLIGLLITAADAGLRSLILSGPSDLSKLLYAAKPFPARPSLTLSVAEASTSAAASALAVTQSEEPSISAVVIDNSHTAFIALFKDLRGKCNPHSGRALGVRTGKLFGVLQRGGEVTLDDGSAVTPVQVLGPGTPGPVVVVVPCPNASLIETVEESKSLSAKNTFVLMARTKDSV